MCHSSRRRDRRSRPGSPAGATLPSMCRFSTPACGLERADQARRGERLRDGKAADRVALTVERAAERGDGGEGQSCEVEIGLKHDVFLPRPGVERAARREGDQIVLGGNGDDLHLGLFSLRGGGFRGFGGFGVRCFVLRRAEDGQGS